MFLKSKYIFFDSIDSTHDFAIKHVDFFDSSLLTCLRAACQTQGRGQQGRSWISPKGNLYVTYVVKKPEKDLTKTANFLALCIYQVLELKGIHTVFKDPNDLFFHKKKCAGVLCHVTQDFLIMSFGLNTSIAPEGFMAVNLETEQIFKEIHQQIQYALPLFIQDGFFPFEKEWEAIKKKS